MSKNNNHSTPSTPFDEQDTEARASAFKEILKQWILYRFAAFCAWLWLLCHFWSWSIPIDYRVEPYLLLPSVLAFLILIVLKKWELVFFYPFYVVLSPTLLVFLPIAIVVRLLFNNTEGASIWVKIIASTISFVRSLRFLVLQLLFVIGSWVFLVYYSPAEYRPLVGSTAHIIGYLLFLQSFRWAANPYRPILFVLKLAAKTFSTILEKLLVDPNLKKKFEDRASGYKALQTIQGGLKKIHDPDNETIHGITAVTHGYLSAIFTAVFFLMFFLVAASFAASLRELELGVGKIIDGIGENAKFADYFYFSFLSQTTAIPDGVKPLTLGGQLWIIWLVTTGLLSLTGLITLFTSSAGVFSNSSLVEIDDVFTVLDLNLQAWQQSLAQEPDPLESS